MFVPDRSVPRIARYTWARQWKAEAFGGVVDGASGLAAFVAMRSLGAKPWIAPLFVTIGQLFWLVAPAWEAAFARFHFRRAFLWMGLAANLPLLAVVFVDPDSTSKGGWLALFAGAVIVQAAVDAAYVPHRAALLRANYPASIRGSLFAMLSTVSKSTSMLAAKLGGWLLDRDAQWLRVVFPAAALCGILEHWTLSRVHWHREGRPPVRRWSGLATGLSAAADAWRQTGRILKEDRRFRLYEIAFMLYGLGFLMGNPMIVVYAERDLRLSYDAYTWALGFAFNAVYIVTILVFGRVVDRLGVARTCAWAFAVLAVFFASLLLVRNGLELTMAYALLGLTMAVVNLGWNLGPLAFAPTGQARAYSTVHVLCVGVRSAIAPFLGLWIASVLSRPDVFACSAALVAFGCLAMLRLGRNLRRSVPVEGAEMMAR